MVEKELLNEITTHLITTHVIAKHVDFWKNQVLGLGTGETNPFPMPAVFLEFPTEIIWQAGGNKTKTANTQIVLHVVQKVLARTSSSTKAASRTQALNYLDVVESVQNKMPLLTKDNLGKIKLVGITHDHSGSPINDTKLRFDIALVNNSGRPVYTTASPGHKVVLP